MAEKLSFAPFIRPDIEYPAFPAAEAAEVSRPLSLPRRVLETAWVRKTLILIALVAAWQAYASYAANPLLVPTFTDTIAALWDAAVSGPLFGRIAVSLRILLTGYGIGLMLAAVLTALAVSFRVGGDLLSLLTGMFNPLPAIALLPLALLWFGLGYGSLVFVIIHSVLWAVALNTLSGFRAVSETLRMVGLNCGLRGIPYILRILVPAAFPSILTGLKIGWAFAWRTEIAAELVFGATSGSGGLGWFIFEARNQLETATVFAGLLAVVIIGLAVENLIFASVERRTVGRWGMQH